MSDQQPQTLSHIQAILLAFSGFTLWVFSDAIVRVLKDYDPIPLVFIANFTALAIALIGAPFMGGFRETITRPKLKLRMARGALLSISTFLSFIAFANLELTTAYAIIFAAPLAAKVLSVFLTGEQIRMRSWLISLLGFAGVLVVIRPGLVPMNIGAMAALGLVFFFALGYVLARKIGPENQTQLSFVIFQYFILSVVCGFIGFEQAIQIPPADIALAASIGVLSLAGNLCVSNAYTKAPTAVVAPVHYTQILWGVALGALLFSEYPDIYTSIGAAIIIAAGLLLIRYSRNPV